MIYCDASLIVALVARERYSEAAENWFGRRSPSRLAISPWVTTEIASALAMKRRNGLLDEPEWKKASVAVVSLVADSFVNLQVTATHFDAAGSRMVHAGRRGLRAGDALHLAIAERHGCTMASLDHDLIDAAASIGLAVERIVPDG